MLSSSVFWITDACAQFAPMLFYLSDIANLYKVCFVCKIKYKKKLLENTKMIIIVLNLM